MLEAIVALPNDLFYNTGIATYIWVLCNKKPSYRKDKVQLINANDLYEKRRKSLGDKREVLPFAKDAWLDKSKTKAGYEIPFIRYFYKYTPPVPAKVLMAEIMDIEKELDGALGEIFSE